MQQQPDLSVFTSTVTTFVSLPVIFFSLLIYIVVLSIKKTVDTAWVGSRTNKVWADLVLPSLPWLIGGLAALAFRQYPYPAGIVAPSARFAFGAVCGFLSSYVYRMIRAFLPKGEGDAAESPRSDRRAAEPARHDDRAGEPHIGDR